MQVLCTVETQEQERAIFLGMKRANVCVATPQEMKVAK
jgi:hypothetical protein